MAKKPTITTVSSGYYGRQALNDNFEAIRDAFDNFVSRDGETPNTMLADLDLNSNNLTNVGTINGADASGLSSFLETVAGIAADVTTVAGISSDVTTVAGNDTNITTVAGISTDVTSVAGVSSDIPTVAAVDTDISTVAGISSDVSTVATNVTDVTNFADVYIGGSASEPTTRSDSSALQEGDLYFNTTSDLLFVYNGSSWQQTTFDQSSVSLTGGTIDGVTIGGTTPAAGSFTTLSSSSVDIDGGAIDGTPIGGTTPAAGNFSTVDIDGGTIDDTAIGGTTPSTGDFTTVTMTTVSGAVTATGVWDFTSTEALRIPVGTTAQRPGTPAKGDFRYNDTDGSPEIYDGSSWGPVGGGGGGLFKGENGEIGTAPGDIFRINEQTLNTDVTIDADENASCTGPLTVASGTTLTVTSGGTLAII